MDGQAQLVKLAGCCCVGSDPIARQCPAVESRRPVQTIGILAHTFKLLSTYWRLLPVAEPTSVIGHGSEGKNVDC